MNLTTAIQPQVVENYTYFFKFETNLFSKSWFLYSHLISDISDLFDRHMIFHDKPTVTRLSPGGVTQSVCQYLPAVQVVVNTVISTLVTVAEKPLVGAQTRDSDSNTVFWNVPKSVHYIFSGFQGFTKLRTTRRIWKVGYSSPGIILVKSLV